MPTKKISVTIHAELYEAFASYAAEKQVSLSCLVRHALQEFAEVSFPDPVRHAKFEALLAEVKAQQLASDLASEARMN